LLSKIADVMSNFHKVPFSPPDALAVACLVLDCGPLRTGSATRSAGTGRSATSAHGSMTGSDTPHHGQLAAPPRRALRGSQLSQGPTSQLALRVVRGLEVHAFEGPARRRAACGVLVNIMPANSSALRTGEGPPNLAGSTARLRIKPAAFGMQRRNSSMLLESRSNSPPRHLRVPFERRHGS